MTIVIEQLLAGKGIELALKGVGGAARAFRGQRDSFGRLLVLLHADFGKDCDLGREVFFSWRNREALRMAFDRVLAGELLRGSSGIAELAEVIAPRLVPTPPEARRMLAERIAAAVFRAAPLVIEGGGEGTRLLTAHLDALTDPRETDAHHAAAKGDEREFVEWLVQRFSYIQTAGIGANQHLQLPLGDVFVPPFGLREQAESTRWGTQAQQELAALDERRRSGKLSREDYEARLDRLAVGHADTTPIDPQRVSVAEVIRDRDRTLILGDPGMGKTTLLRYLVVQHARALIDGESTVGGGLGVPRVPVYLRAGEFARSGDREKGFGAFIAPFLLGSLECPLGDDRLCALIATLLRAGRCVVMIDGLDEVSNAADRAVVVQSITSFVAAQQPRGNNFVCTSRISGYGAAPLPAAFARVRLVEMDNASIDRFLRGYVPAIERSEAPAKSAAIIAQDADRTITRLVSAFERSPGVRRLAANPLLLTALLLVHRSGALPERRVEAYKAVADVLGRSWRASQGVPETELPDERRLIIWLTRLAEWMHAERSEGSADLRDLIQILGPLWAEFQRYAWDERVLDQADPTSTETGSGILQFIRQIEDHCGLLVERAPGRWAFPHLTFEEFYVARSLAFGRVSDRAARIRGRLHDARYHEPILLALGLVGIDYSEEIEELFDAAVLGEGNEAVRLGFRPSLFENLLGRDFRFALRALADDIPLSPRRVDALLSQALDELLHVAGRGRFSLYHDALLDCLDALKRVPAGVRLATLLAQEVAATTLANKSTREAFLAIAARCSYHPVVAERLADIAIGEPNALATARAAGVLAEYGELPRIVADRLEEIATSGDRLAVASACGVLAQYGELPRTAADRLVQIAASGDRLAASRASSALARHAERCRGVAERGEERITSSDRPARQAVPGRTVEESTHRVPASVGWVEAGNVSSVSAGSGELPPAIADRLAKIAGTHDEAEAIRAARVLGQYGELSDAVAKRLVTIATNDHLDLSIHAAGVLAQLGKLPDAVYERLEAIAGSPDPTAAIGAANVLAQYETLPLPIADRLAESALEGHAIAYHALWHAYAV